MNGAAERKIDDNEICEFFELPGDNPVENSIINNPEQASNIIFGRDKKYRITHICVFSNGSVGFGVEDNGIFSSTLMLAVEFCPGFVIERVDQKIEYTIVSNQTYDSDRKVYYQTKIIVQKNGQKHRIYETYRKDGKEMLSVTEYE